MYKLTFYVPADYVDVVKNAVFAAGAGKVGYYEHCAWQVLGTGQFKPLKGADPFIGKAGEIETVQEYRVEIVLEELFLQDVKNALLQSHPYEEPAYDFVKLVDI